MMRYLCLWKPADPKVEAGVPPSAAEIANMGQLIEEMTRAGVLISTEGCQASAKGVRVRRSGDKVTVTDGPFTESKELVAGVAIIQVKSKEEAIHWTKRFVQVAGDGESEIRLLHEEADFMPPESRERDSRAEVAKQR